MSRRDASLRRRVGTTPLRRRVLVLTEGLRTEPSYLTAWARYLRDRLALEIGDRHGTPATLVQYAIDAVEQSRTAVRRGRADPYDSIWCMFDIDEHPEVEEAIARAGQHGIEIAVSNPCLELWFLLHWIEQTSHLDRLEAQSAVRPYLGQGKTIAASVASELIARNDLAADRARKLAMRHDQNGSPPRANPSSTVWRLIEDLRKSPQQP